MSLAELVDTRRNQIDELEKYESLSEMFQRSVDQINKKFGKHIDLPSATAEFNSLLTEKKADFAGPGADSESDLSDGEREAKNAQMEGFMLLYEIFRPLTSDYLEQMVEEEKQQAKLNLATQHITSTLKSTEELGKGLIRQLYEKGVKP